MLTLTQVAWACSGTGERQFVLTLTQVALGLQVLGAGCEYWDESESLEAVSESTQSAHMYVCEEAYLSRHGCFSVHCCVPGRIPRTYTIMVGEVEPFRSSSGENLQ